MKKIKTPLRIEVGCIECGKTELINCDLNDYNNWKYGSLHIQDAMPYLSDSQREMLLSSLCEKCFDNLAAWLDDNEEYDKRSPF